MDSQSYPGVGAPAGSSPDLREVGRQLGQLGRSMRNAAAANPDIRRVVEEARTDLPRAEEVLGCSYVEALKCAPAEWLERDFRPRDVVKAGRSGYRGRRALAVAASWYRPSASLREPAVAAMPASVPSARSREHGGTRRSRATRSGDDPDPEPPRCRCGCGEAVPPGKRHYVDDAHANRARQRRFKERARAARADRQVLARYELEIEKLRRAGGLTGYEALDLRMRPRERVLRMLAEPTA